MINGCLAAETGEVVPEGSSICCQLGVTRRPPNIAIQLASPSMVIS